MPTLTDVEAAFHWKDEYDVMMALSTFIAETHGWNDDDSQPIREADYEATWDWSDFPEVEKVVLYTTWLDMEVSNGGFHQYFSNTAGNNALETLKVLKRIEAVKTADILARALSIFPDGRPPKNREERWNQLAVAGEEAVEFLSALNGEYYDQDEYVYTLAVGFLKERKTDFVSTGSISD